MTIAAIILLIAGSGLVGFSIGGLICRSKIEDYKITYYFQKAKCIAELNDLISQIERMRDAL